MLVEGHDHTPEFLWTMVFYSDDLGRTWQRCQNTLWAWLDDPEAGLSLHSPLGEPVAVEMEKDHVLMMMRSVLGRILQSESLRRRSDVVDPAGNRVGRLRLAVHDPKDPLRPAICSSSGIRFPRRKSAGASNAPGSVAPSPATKARAGATSRPWTSAADCPRWKRSPFHRSATTGPSMTLGAFPRISERSAIPISPLSMIGSLFAYAVQDMKPVSEWTEKTRITGERNSYGKIKAAAIETLYR